MSAGPSEQLDHVRDQRIAWVTGLISPRVLLDEQPLAPGLEEFVLRGRSAVAEVLDRIDDRLLVVVGPCSVHDPDAALDYAGRLSTAARELSDDLLVVMRVYFEKPRTTTGWKGLINDPHLDDTGDVNEGLRLARKLLLEVLALDLPVGCEFLDPITPQYIADAVSWGAIGARTTESQIHRQLASGLSMPVGFKNRTDGNLAVAVDAVRAAAVPHTFAGIDLAGSPAVLHTRGNHDCHVILRGGRAVPNYDAEGVGDALERLRAVGLPERVVVDASHDNSGKDAGRQPGVAADIAAQISGGNAALVGVMLESFIVAGRQDLKDGVTPTYGQSITDACMSWEGTEEVLAGLAEAVRARRRVR
ncbi:MAG TPA: 3-deoxy-7-phosphoheptulonate synthase [Solirubrobacteraceae bacterium]|nr:3-deoxy-7-phosphoheptulonate synthase [Solirubrobacteraceae bacterium]